MNILNKSSYSKKNVSSNSSADRMTDAIHLAVLIATLGGTFCSKKLRQTTKYVHCTAKPDNNHEYEVILFHAPDKCCRVTKSMNVSEIVNSS